MVVTISGPKTVFRIYRANLQKLLMKIYILVARSQSHTSTHNRLSRSLRWILNVNFSFHTGLRHFLIVLVFFLLLELSGCNFNFTYGSDVPVGSIGIKFFACWTVVVKDMKRCRKPARDREMSKSKCFKPGSISSSLQKGTFFASKKMNRFQQKGAKKARS